MPILGHFVRLSCCDADGDCHDNKNDDHNYNKDDDSNDCDKNDDNDL